jgi:hypothetical protein
MANKILPGTGKFSGPKKAPPRNRNSKPRTSSHRKPTTESSAPDAPLPLIPGKVLRWAAEHVKPPACSDEVDDMPFDTSKATRPSKSKPS